MRTNERRLNQVGIASILFTMIMMVVISLIVLSFAQVARRGQREALDSQLSTQAYYAAESGVNEAQRVLAELINSSNPNLDNEGCGLTNEAYSTRINSMQLADGVSFSCFKVTTELASLSATDVAPGEAQVLYLEPNGPFNQINFSWKPDADAGELNKCPSSGSRDGDFKPINTWECPYSVIRIDLVPVSGSMTREALLNSTMTVFAVPSKSGPASNTPYSTSGVVTQGARSNAGCDDSECTIHITGLSGNYAMRIMSQYFVTPQITVTGNSGVTFKNGQALIDVTGRAQDVMRRVQVRVPLSRISSSSDYAIGTKESLCKRFTVNEPKGMVDDTDCPTGASLVGGGDPINAPVRQPPGGGSCGIIACDGPNAPSNQ